MSQDKIHVMVDIETLGVIPSAVILSIGAITIVNSPVPEWNFYQELDTDTQFERTKSQSTIDWWAKQPEGLMPKGSTDIRKALSNFHEFFSHLRAEPIVWCKGTDCDIAILTHAFTQYHMPVPWKYDAVRDFRTLKKLFPHYSYPANPNAHNALADAKHQAEELKAIFKANPNLTMA